MAWQSAGRLFGVVADEPGTIPTVAGALSVAAAMAAYLPAPGAAFLRLSAQQTPGVSTSEAHGSCHGVGAHRLHYQVARSHRAPNRTRTVEADMMTHRSSVALALHSHHKDSCQNTGGWTNQTGALSVMNTDTPTATCSRCSPSVRLKINEWARTPRKQNLKFTHAMRRRQ